MHDNKSMGMHNNSHSGKYTGADVMFLQMMIPHHLQAIDISNVALKTSKDTELLALADTIIKAQTSEILQMQSWLQDANATEDMGHSMSGMGGMLDDKELSALSAATGKNFDMLWLEGMIGHHDGAIHMATMIRDASNSDIKTFGESVVKDQSAQGTYDQAQQSRTSDSEFSLSGEPSVAGKCNNRNATTAAGASCHPLVPTSFDPSKYRAESLSQNVYEACEWYSNIRSCMRDCDAACRERLQGYERVCRAASSMMQPNGGSIGVIAGINCATSQPYQEFGMNMRRCLQDRVAMTVNGGSCPSCTTLINGMPGDIETGIIGAHTPCVRNTRMCQLSQADKKCFGAAFGYGFGAVNPFAGAPTGAGLGGELQGPFKAVGICHLFSQFPYLLSDDINFHFLAHALIFN
jgi:uncharacterized protein (DUF305 family)